MVSIPPPSARTARCALPVEDLLHLFEASLRLDGVESGNAPPKADEPSHRTAIERSVPRAIPPSS